MNREKYETIKRELRDDVDLNDAQARLEVGKIESKAQGFRDGVWAAMRAFESAVEITEE